MLMRTRGGFCKRSCELGEDFVNALYIFDVIASSMRKDSRCGCETQSRTPSEVQAQSKFWIKWVGRGEKRIMAAKSW